MKTINSGISDVVYHFTQIGYATEILEDNKFALTFVSGADDNNNFKNKYYYLSTTRSKTGSFHRDSNIGVLLKLNGVKLRNNYVGNPVDYWGREFRKVAPHKNEMEDRIWSDKPFIEPAIKYIDEIHIYFIGNESMKSDKIYNDQMKRALRKLLLLAKKNRIPTYIYTDSQSANLLDKRKAIPLTKIDLTSKPKEQHREYGMRDDVAPWMELYEKDNKNYFSKEPFGGAERKLRSLRSMDGFRGFEADVHNCKRGTPAVHRLAKVLKKNNWKLAEFYKFLQKKWLGYEY